MSDYEFLLNVRQGIDIDHRFGCLAYGVFK